MMMVSKMESGVRKILNVNQDFVVTMDLFYPESQKTMITLFACKKIQKKKILLAGVMMNAIYTQDLYSLDAREILI